MGKFIFLGFLLLLYGGSILDKNKKSGDNDKKIENKGKGSVALGVLIMVVSVVSGLGNSSTDTAIKEISTASSDEYNEVIDIPVYKFFGHFDTTIENLDNTINEMANGELDQMSAYTKVSKLDEQLQYLSKEWRDLESIDGFDDAQREHFKNMKDNYSDAISSYQTATSILKKSLDNNELKPSDAEMINGLRSDGTKLLEDAKQNKQELDDTFN